MSIELSRRGFLQTTGATSAALFIGLNTGGVFAVGHEAEALVNPFVRIAKDGTVSVLIKHFEMGQGTTTGLTTLVAEEMDAAWDKVVPEFAPSADQYKNLAFGSQGTGGSTAIANSFMQYRQAGAAAREVLVRAASQKWGVAESEIMVDNSMLSVGNRSAHFGEFIDAAVKLMPSPEPVTKTPDQFKLIGKVDLPRKDSVSKTNGTAMFAMDLKVPGMVYAAVVRSPKFGGMLSGFDAAEATKINGFIDAKALPNKAGVVVYARHTYAAFEASKAIEASWDFSQAEERSSSTMIEDQRKMAAENPQFNVHKEVDLAGVQAKIEAAVEKVEIEYTFPMLAHAPMESLNCLIEPTSDGGVLLTDGCQFPGITHPTVAAVLGLDPSKVEIKTVYAGGSFGRRATPTADYQTEAALAFDLLGRQTPVKLVWSREDDLKGGYYRPPALHKATMGFDADGNMVGWDHHVVVKSILKGGPFEAFLVKDGIDEVSIEGMGHTIYKFDDHAVGLSDFLTPVTVLWWRAVGHTHTAYAMETLVDVMAEKAGQDPVDFRLAQLDKVGGAQQQRLAGVIREAAELADWKGKRAAGRHLGIAAHFSFNTYVAVIAEVTVNEDNEHHVDNLWIAVDCGVVINPDVVVAQMEGGAGYGLAAILRDEITLEDGIVQQENFPDYEPLRIGEMPDVHVAIVLSNEAPTGVGEPATPPTPPAVANAVFAATGKRLTQLPFTKEGVEFV